MKNLLISLFIVVLTPYYCLSQDSNEKVKVKIISFDSIKPYYIIIGETTDNTQITILSLKDTDTNKNCSVLEKIKLNNTYELRLKRMSWMFVNEELSESVVFPDSPFYYDGKLISTIAKGPYQSEDIIGLYIIR